MIIWDIVSLGEKSFYIKSIKSQWAILNSRLSTPTILDCRGFIFIFMFRPQAQAELLSQPAGAPRTSRQ